MACPRRYSKVRENCSAFDITQFGLSCFKLSADGRSYEAKTFNAYIFPEPLAFDLSGGMGTRKFSCDAGQRQVTWISMQQLD